MLGEVQIFMTLSKLIFLYNVHVENGFKVQDIKPSIFKISKRSKKSQYFPILLFAFGL